ncbi:hypothetical protein E2320_013170 [Naja naja]|nr:hypothetical protein E2320_013170 [Naja naja]
MEQPWPWLAWRIKAARIKRDGQQLRPQAFPPSPLSLHQNGQHGWFRQLWERFLGRLPPLPSLSQPWQTLLDVLTQQGQSRGQILPGISQGGPPHCVTGSPPRKAFACGSRHLGGPGLPLEKPEWHLLSFHDLPLIRLIRQPAGALKAALIPRQLKQGSPSLEAANVACTFERLTVSGVRAWEGLPGFSLWYPFPPASGTAASLITPQLSMLGSSQQPPGQAKSISWVTRAASGWA